ncbi:MAG TPA: hypothetical protein VHA35_01460 [Dongiaceae bacterium]|jgi:hypothetical protein|nr:hypothetical protein [Dongiaceae bacterium]
MTLEVAVDPPVHAVSRPLTLKGGQAAQSTGSAGHRSVTIALLLWAARIASVVYTMCYAYHIGL